MDPISRIKKLDGDRYSFTDGYIGLETLMLGGTAFYATTRKVDPETALEYVCDWIDYDPSVGASKVAKSRVKAAALHLQDQGVIPAVTELDEAISWARQHNCRKLAELYRASKRET